MKRLFVSYVREAEHADPSHGNAVLDDVEMPQSADDIIKIQETIRD